MKIRTFALVGALMMSVAGSLSAAAITVDAGWYGFCFEDTAGSPATEGCQNDGIGVSGNATTFTALVPVLFQITDAFNSGDVFDVWIDGLFAFTTSPSATGTSGVSDPDIAYADPAYSHGSALLGAGTYSVDVFVNDAPAGSGGAYLQVISADVPEPASLLLFGAGLLGLSLLRRRATN